MTSDLERELRDALRHRADAVTQADLQHGDTPPDAADGIVVPLGSSPRRVAALVAAVLAAACLVAGVAALAFWPRSSESRGSAAAGRSSAADHIYDPGFSPSPWWGTSWTLQQVRGPQGTVAIPKRVGAEIAFGPVGRIAATDSITASTGNCAIRSDGTIRVRDAYTTAMGYAGHDRAILAAIAGIDAFVNSGTAGAAAHRDGSTLTVHTRKYTLRFTQGRPVATSTAPPTSTVSAPASHSYINGSELAPS